MNSSASIAGKATIANLMAACHNNANEDALAQFIKPAHWGLLEPYLQPVPLTQAQVLISRGANERSVYFIENGSLSVHYEREPGRVRMAVVMAGSAVGEGGFFSHQPRNATVQAASACRVWVLTPIRFGELTNRQPGVALAVVMGLGALMSRRMLDRRKRISVT